MIYIHDLQKLKKEVKNLNSAVIVLKDAVSNDIGVTEFCHLEDSLDMLIAKTEKIMDLYKENAEVIHETEVCLESNIIFCNIRSLLVILKYSMRAKRSKVTFADIYNFFDVISKQTQYALNLTIQIVKNSMSDNVYTTL